MGLPWVNPQYAGAPLDGHLFQVDVQTHHVFVACVFLRLSFFVMCFVGVQILRFSVRVWVHKRKLFETKSDPPSKKNMKR